MATCFIAMPITTAEPEKYQNDQHHFLHVLDHLFVPAIEKSGLTPIRPVAEGSDLIHAEIIKNIEHADLVLCDMSALNPNVFFELGIRTAINKPMCIVKDDKTTKVPFDTSILNNYTYSSALQPWTLTAEINALATHITKTLERSKSENPLWKFFGLSTRAELPEGSTPIEEQVSLLAYQIEGISKQLNQSTSLARHLEKQLPQNNRENMSYSHDEKFIIREVVKVMQDSVSKKIRSMTLPEIKQLYHTIDSSLPQTYKDSLRRMEALNSDYVITNLGAHLLAFLGK